jgi:hypothetical protein
MIARIVMAIVFFLKILQEFFVLKFNGLLIEFRTVEFRCIVLRVYKNFKINFYFI